MSHSLRRISFLLLLALALPFSISACSAAADDPDSEEITEDTESVGEGVSGSLTVGTQLKATGNVNLRTASNTSSSVLTVVPSGSTVTVQAASPSNGFYKVKFDGLTGWSSGKYYEPNGSSGDSIPVGTTLTATAGVNLRSGPSTSHSVITVVSIGDTVTVQQAEPQNGYYKVKSGSHVGWSAGKYYSQGGGGGTNTGNAKIDAAMARAKSGVGFSYWWGHGRWRSEGPTSSTKGSCSGSCPSCTHSGSYGADCSGYVAKIWEVPSSNDDITSDSHPYSTADFHGDTSLWKTVSKGSLKMADAMVYRSGGAGHIFLYEKGDGWGSMYAYECKGCAAGCIKGFRTATSSYHGIRRTGF
jgi:uncharacterized protein YraI